MGRIKTDGMVLVDVKEAQELLGKSRARVFGMLRQGKLTRVHVAGYQKSFITLESIQRAQGPQFQLKMLDPDDVRERRQKELNKRFPHIIKLRDRTPQGLPPDRSPSSEG